MSKLQEDILLWPPTPNPESYKSDLPNEGFGFNVTDEFSIVNYFSDYQGIFLFLSERPDLMFERLEITPTKNKEYLSAYQIILEEFECCWHNPLPTEANWPEIAYKIIKRLKETGRTEMQNLETESEIYWEIKR